MKAKASGFFVSGALLAVLLVVCVNSWLALRSVRVLGDSEYWVSHTWQTISALQEVISSAKDAETGNRGYLLTQEDDYLAPYTRAVHDLPAEIDAVEHLTADNPRQKAKIPELRAAVEQRLQLLSQGIEARRSGEDNTTRLLVLTGTGESEMQHLRSIVNAMQEEEQGLLKTRVAKSASARVQARYTVLFAGIFDVLMIALSFWLLERERMARRAAEASALAVQKLNTELEDRVRSRTAELEATNRELEAFSYSVSHDLRAPLRSVDGFSLALAEDYGGLLGDDGKDFVRRIRTGVQKMGLLIDSLLQLSRITRAEVTREDISISELAADVARDLRAQNPQRNLTFMIEPGMNVYGDARLLRVALENMMGNAVKFTANQPEAKIEFGRSDETGEFYIRDNGAGFDMKYANKLFVAFQRLHGDKDFQGSGIGLATVSRVIHRHRGTMRAEGAVNQGATFWFTLG